MSTPHLCIVSGLRLGLGEAGLVGAVLGLQGAPGRAAAAGQDRNEAALSVGVWPSLAAAAQRLVLLVLGSVGAAVAGAGVPGVHWRLLLVQLAGLVTSVPLSVPQPDHLLLDIKCVCRLYRNIR